MLNNGGMPIHEPGLEEIVARNARRRPLHVLDRRRRRAWRTATCSSSPSARRRTKTARPICNTCSPRPATSAAHERLQGHRRQIDGPGRHGAARAARWSRKSWQARARAATQHRFSVVSNPEFLKEGAAVDDFMRPDRIVIGCDEDEAGQRARELMKHLYAPFNRNHERTFCMDVRSAEFTKYAANAMLATRISFMNETGQSGRPGRRRYRSGAPRHRLRSAHRLHFLYAGCGYGGSCFPKDVQALDRTAREYGQDLRILAPSKRSTTSRSTCWARRSPSASAMI